MTYKKEEKMKLGIDMGGMSIKMGLGNGGILLGRNRQQSQGYV